MVVHAISILHEERTASCLKVLSFVFPFISIKACIISYFYAQKKTGVPALSQLIEQISRVCSIFLLVSFFLSFLQKNAVLATLGLVIGEGVSCLFCLCFIIPWKKRIQALAITNSSEKILLAKRFFSYGLPVIATRLSITILQCMEAILIPLMLTKLSHDKDSFLIIYGTLTGMALPFITFPSAITNSLAVLLLPTISKAKACHNQK